jgi:hypothetical protein
MNKSAVAALFSLSAFILTGPAALSQIAWPGVPPGKARVVHKGASYTLENNVLRMSWRLDGSLEPLVFEDKVTGELLNLRAAPAFRLVLKNGKFIDGSRFLLAGSPQVRALRPDHRAACYADRMKGESVSLALRDSLSGIIVHWEARLTDGSNEVQQRWRLQAVKPVDVVSYRMLEVPGAGVRQVGRVEGSPLVLGQMFFALQYPMSRNEVTGTGAAGYLRRQAPLTEKDSLVLTTASGITPRRQLRRGFLYYIERERAHPYRPFLHYNSWYDLSWIDRKLEAASCMDRIRTYGDSLVKKRHVPVKAFLFDDGWDNDSTLWETGAGFPQGFAPLKRLAESFGAGLGIWISPWGGYDPQKSERLQYGRRQNPPFETNDHGFSMAGPVYYRRFSQVATRFIRQDGVRIFKFDGIGSGNGASGVAPAYEKDIAALLRLTRQLRRLEPDIFLSLTVGTWPSPYWLFYGDATWRAGNDFGLTGEGDKRQQWITYRDGQVYNNVVQRAPLYPLNSLMSHGICIADTGYPAPLEMDFNDIADGIWDFFGSGTDLQEMYVNPHKLSSSMWDELARAARWSHDNRDVLADVHWVGGDPLKGEVYGYAAWSPRKGTLVLRNPSAHPQTLAVLLGKFLDLPSSSAATYILKDVRTPRSASIRMNSAKAVSITLKPFGLRVWDVYRQ